MPSPKGHDPGRRVPARTPAGSLEHDRLTPRARSLTAAIAALRRQAGGRSADAHAPNPHLHQAIRDFEAEVVAINARLSDLAAGAAPARIRRDPPPDDWGTT